MATTRTLQELLGTYSSEVQSLARTTKAFLLDLLPGAEETVDGSGPYVSYGYGTGYKGMVSGFSVNKQGVKLLIPGGAALPDPKGLLEGEGKVHRHIVIASSEDLRQPGVKALVRGALAGWKKKGSCTLE